MIKCLKRRKHKVFLLIQSLLPDFNEKILFENTDNNFMDHHARDGQHPDEVWHERVAEMFFQQYLAK